MKNRLAKHIESLLVRDECVVVRGLGAFILEKKSAYWQKDELLAYPPSVALHFNQNLNHQDGLLEQRYAEVYAVSQRRARLMIEQDVRALNTQLLEHSVVILEGLGELKLSQAGVISFEPQLSHSLKSVSYGLQAIVTPTAKLAQDSKASAVEADSSYVNFRLSKRFLAWTSVAAIFIMALLPWGNRVEDATSYRASLAPSASFIKQFFTKEEVKQVTEVELKADTLSSKAEVQTNEDIEPLVEKLVLPYAEEVSGRYYVIIASEKREANMLKDYEQAQMKAELFPNLEVLSMGSRLRLSGGSFSSSAKAYEYLHQLEECGVASWVYKGKS